MCLLQKDTVMSYNFNIVKTKDCPSFIFFIYLFYFIFVIPL